MTASKATAVARLHGKKYAEKAKLIEENKIYSVAEAADLLTKLSPSTFDATAEVHIKINADTAQADQLVRTTVSLPHGTGKTIRIAAFVPDDQADAATKAGADIAGLSTIIPDVEKEKINFDIAVATPDVMKELGKVAKVLGQRGLMPNPKAGTVTPDIAKAIKELKKGRIECKMDKQGIIHATFGKISFGADKLKENLETILQAIKEAQPAGIKGVYIQSISVSPTMGPGVKVAA
ncbi:MAG: 50S ribosomal protein L1 [Candidatus Peribacteraceae bacterium]|nr:50S ribosomal protein L1 [Candidatus Peribacteraceae bacterium]